MNSVGGFIAVTRFGLGPRPGELLSAAADPAGWLKQQIQAPAPVPAELAGFPSAGERLGDLQRARAAAGDGGVQLFIQSSFRETYRQEMAARQRVHIATDQPFRERLVAFWSNHFTVSVQRPPVTGLAGAFEREAIRPHVTGRFADMLLAVARHPAMLAYLDNAQSVGPQSPAGLRTGRGLNENLAREILELHTLGVDGGYTQNDVREFARILTGWSVGQIGLGGTPGHFMFRPRTHDTGTKTLLGVRYGESGEQEGVLAMQALARHDATARHVATKLARHFIADDPPPRAVERLTGVFRDTDGNLAALSEALVEQPEAWDAALPKIRSPQDFVTAALRATEYDGPGDTATGAARLLGQMPFAAPSPAGWPDTATGWIGPDAVLRRAEWAMALGLRVAAIRDAPAMFAETIAPVAGRATTQAISWAPSAGEAAALLFASPEFQRR